MVPLDGSKLAECVLPHVQAIASGCGVVEVVLVRVVPPVTIPAGDTGYVFNAAQLKEFEESQLAEAKGYLSQVASQLKLNGANIRTESLKGDPANQLAEYAQKNNFDLIVIASHGRSGISRWVWGSVTDKVLRSACVPVMMVRAPGCVPGI